MGVNEKDVEGEGRREMERLAEKERKAKVNVYIRSITSLIASE